MISFFLILYHTKSKEVSKYLGLMMGFSFGSLLKTDPWIKKTENQTTFKIRKTFNFFSQQIFKKCKNIRFSNTHLLLAMFPLSLPALPGLGIELTIIRSLNKILIHPTIQHY